MRTSLIALIVATVGHAGTAFAEPMIMRTAPMMQNAPALNVVRPLVAPVDRAPVVVPRALDVAPRAMDVAPRMRQIEPRSLLHRSILRGIEQWCWIIQQ